MRVIVTEKPSVARQFANALKISGKGNGCITGRSPVDNEEYIITWAVGHLVKMSYPEKYSKDMEKWNLSTLPFIPKIWKYEIIPQLKKQFDIINKILSSMKPGDIYYNAGDSGREGQYIQDLIVMMSKLPKSIEKRRIWIDSQTDSEILRGIREAKNAAYYKDLTDSAYVRAKEDYLVGINYSRLLSCAFGRQFNNAIKSDKYKAISVGRVMTCVLGMIVRREREIRNFKEQKFYKVEAFTGFNSSWKVCDTSAYFNSLLLYSDTGFKEKKDAESFAADLSKNLKLTVASVKSSDVKKQAPTLYNLAELQAECSKKFKISPDKTLEIAQSLYEKKLTTYPRTDARVLSTPVAKEIRNNIAGIRDNVGLFDFEVTFVLSSGFYEGIENKKRYTDDSKITDHYAIIPTGEGSVASLSDMERNVYEMITRRFLAIFYPPAIYNKIEAMLTHEDKERFYATAEFLVDMGYLNVYSSDDEEDSSKNANMTAIKDIKEGDTLDASFKVTEGKTQPPKRYTSGSIIIAMENAGNLIEDAELRNQIKGAGIGTSATRAEIISKLVNIGYISLNSKTQVLTPAIPGEAVYDIVIKTIPDLLIPETTAKWEQSLEEIATGKVSSDKVMTDIEKSVETTVNTIKKKA